MNTYRFEIFEPDLLDQISGLRKQLWGRSRTDNRTYLTWKYLENPYLPDPLIYVARAGDEVVGMRGMYGTSWLVPGIDGRVVLPCSGDSGISPEHRESGLFAALTDFALADLKKRGFRHVINMSATPANYVTSIVTMGWKKVASYDPLIRSTTPMSQTPAPALPSGTDRPLLPLRNSERMKAIVRRMRSIRKMAFAKDPFATSDKNRRHVDHDSPIEITAVPRPRGMARLAREHCSDTSIRHVRDETYFGWRYRNPFAFYRFLFLKGDLGYLVLQGTSGSRRIQLVDWASDDSAFGELLRAGLEYGRTPQMGTWGTSLPPAVRQHLDQAGFAPDGSSAMARRGGLIVRALDPTNGDDSMMGICRLLDAANWDLRMVYSDRF
ncbi:MAG: GNAT family N-acetyltransferase [Acidimicrobiia bacterium]